MTNDKIKRTNCIVLILFGGSVLLRFLLGNFYPRTINCYPDELLYLSLGESLWNNHSIQVYNLASSYSKMAYPMLIAPAFAFGEVKMQSMMIALINATVISLGVFPVYGLAKRTLSRERHILFCVILYVISPSMTYSMTYMSENLSIPLSLCFIYLIYRIWEEERITGKLLRGLVALGVMILCYVTKSVAMVFVVAFVMLVLTEWMSGGGAKRIWACVLGMGLLLIGLLVGYTKLFPADILEKSGYVIFGFLFFVIASVLGFCVIPVVLPGIHYKIMDKNSKKLYLFLVYTLLITAAVVSCMIYTTEDYPSLTPRAHLRYVEFLFVPFVILFFRQMEKGAEPISRRPMFLVFGAWAVTCLVVFRGFSGQTIDQTLLFYWQLVAREGKYFSPVVVRLISAAIIITVAIFMILYVKNRRTFERLLTLGLIVMCVGNSALSVYVQYRTHTHTEEETLEAEQLRDFVREHKEENFLVLEPATYCEMIDTFLIDCDNVRTGMEPFATQNEDDFKIPSDINYAVVYAQGYEVVDEAQCIATFPALGYSLYEIKGDIVLEE